jgi:hypothetical protein
MHYEVDLYSNICIGLEQPVSKQSRTCCWRRVIRDILLVCLGVFEDVPLFRHVLVALVAHLYLLNVQSTRVKRQQGNAVVAGTVACSCNGAPVVSGTLQSDSSSIGNEQTVQMEQTCRCQCWRLKRYKAESVLRVEGNRFNRVHHVVHVHSDTTMTRIICVVAAVGHGSDLDRLPYGMVDHVCLDVSLTGSRKGKMQFACIVLLSLLVLDFLPNFHLLDGTLGMSLETCQITTVTHHGLSVMKRTFTNRHPSACRCMLTRPWRSAMGMTTGTRFLVAVARLGRTVMIGTSGTKQAAPAAAVILTVDSNIIMIYTGIWLVKGH